MNVLWIVSTPVRVIDNKLTSDLASARYRVLLPAKEMATRAHKIYLVTVNNETNPKAIFETNQCDVVVISKSFLSITEEIADIAHRRGIPVIVDICDNHFEDEAKRNHLYNLAIKATKIVVSTSEMGAILSEYVNNHDFEIIPDPVEMDRKDPHCNFSNKVGLVWFGHPVNFDSLFDFLKNLPRLRLTVPITLTLVTRGDQNLRKFVAEIQQKVAPNIEIKIVEWSVETLGDELERCHAVLIPHIMNRQKLPKSANRVTESLWRGAYVIANEIPSYSEFSGWISLGKDIISGIERFIEDNGKHDALVELAQRHIEDNYSQQRIGKMWEMNIEQVISVHKSTLPIKLNLGCGDKILAGYVNVDVAPSRAGKIPDVLCDLRKLEPFRSDSVDEILSVHVIEHFWRWEVVDILREWVRVLRPGGKMIIECPNLQSACEEFLKDPDAFSSDGKAGQRTMWVFYGDPSWRDPLMIHRWGYTPKSLARVLFEAGLVNLRQEPAQFKLREPRDMRVVGDKPL